MPVCFAFQPIIDLSLGTVFAYEALVRGVDNTPAAAVFANVSPQELPAFDSELSREAIAHATALGLEKTLSVNLTPRTLEVLPETAERLLECAARCQIPPGRLILEVTEGDVIGDPVGFTRQVSTLRAAGVRVAIDDFGAGYSGLNLLADFQPDIVKLDMNLVRSIDTRGPRQAIVGAVLMACSDLGIEVVAEGVETLGELHWLRRHGVVLFQGFLVARPAFEALEVPPLETMNKLRRSGSQS